MAHSAAPRSFPVCRGDGDLAREFCRRLETTLDRGNEAGGGDAIRAEEAKAALRRAVRKARPSVELGLRARAAA